MSVKGVGEGPPSRHAERLGAVRVRPELLDELVDLPLEFNHVEVLVGGAELSLNLG